MKRTSLEQRIRERAYEIWNAEGRADGRANEHWLAAEREVLGSELVRAAAQKTGIGRKALSRRGSHHAPAPLAPKM